MLNENIAMNIGIIVGCAIATGVIVYRYCKNSSAGKKQRRKKIMVESTNVDVLNISELSEWFKDSYSHSSEDAKMVIAYPTKEVLDRLGCNFSEYLDSKICVVQFIYELTTENILAVRIVNYSEIDSNLQALLEEHDGMLVISK